MFDFGSLGDLLGGAEEIIDPQAIIEDTIGGASEQIQQITENPLDILP